MSPTIQQLFDLTGRAALVIGGAGYLGAAMCEGLAEAGARVAVTSRDLDKARATVTRLPGGEQQHLPLVADVATDEGARAAVERAAAHFGRLDILVTCTVDHHRVNIDTATGDDFDHALAATLTGPFVASQQAVVHMRRAGGGSIIHVGSTYSATASYPQVYENIKPPPPPMYHAAKGGLAQLARYQAVYWAPDRIRVNTLSPGPFPPSGANVPTRVGAVADDTQREFLRRIASFVPLGRIGEPWELKGAVVFLASDASTFVTGHNLFVDGGWTAW